MNGNLKQENAYMYIERMLIFFFKANLVINFYHALIISEKMVKTIDSITEVYKKKVMNERSSNDI